MVFFVALVDMYSFEGHAGRFKFRWPPLLWLSRINVCHVENGCCSLISSINSQLCIEENKTFQDLIQNF